MIDSRSTSLSLGSLRRGVLGLGMLCALSGGCGDDDDEPLVRDAGEKDGGSEPDTKDAGYQPDKKDSGVSTKEDAGARDAGSHDASTRDTGTEMPEPDAGVSYSGLVVDSTPKEQDLDLFGAPGHRFWLEVNDEQLKRLNEGGGGYYPGGDDIYVPPVSGSFADHVVVQDAKSGSVADYGKMEIKLVGESTFRNWSSSTIPNIHIDTDQFQEKARIGTFEHFRLNNSIVGSIFREQIAHRVFRSLGYPALRASFAFLGSNVWGDGVWVPMTLIEMYKIRFCDDNEELLGGTCENMWEFAGDLGNGGGGGFPGGPGGFPGEFGGGIPIDDLQEPADAIPANYCQVKTCDNTRLGELSAKLSHTPLGPGFADAIDDYVAWDRFHQFQCLTWMLWVGDDPIHNSNNNLIIQRDDGKMIWAPYSVDISAGQDWYQSTTLTGSNSLARGCQSDPECWADTISACEKLIEKFDKLNPEKIVDQTQKTLTSLDMMRDGDLQRAKDLRAWYVSRQTELAGELERYRYLPNVSNECPDGLELCQSGNDPYGQGSCGTPEQCVEWQCPVRWQWCEQYGQCITQDQECVTCEGETPYYCDFSQTCVASSEQCLNPCGPGYEYCRAYASCVPSGQCPGGEIDAGVDDGVDDGGGGIMLPGMGK